MSLVTAVENDIKNAAKWIGEAVTGLAKIGKLWNLIQSNGTRALILKLASDVFAVVNDADVAALAGGINFTLDASVVTAIKGLIADAKGGSSVLTSDLQVLGLDLSTPATPTPVPAPVVAAVTPPVVAAAAQVVVQTSPLSPAPAAVSVATPPEPTVSAAAVVSHSAIVAE